MYEQYELLLQQCSNAVNVNYKSNIVYLKIIYLVNATLTHGYKINNRVWPNQLTLIAVSGYNSGYS